MKRLVVLSVVALLVMTAGCGMTSPAADEARDGGDMATVTTTESGSDHSETVPVGAMLPDGYSQDGITDAETAIAEHQAALSNGSYQIIYEETTFGNESETVESSTTNVSIADSEWLQTQKVTEQGVVKQVYQASDARTVRTVGADGSAAVSVEEAEFQVTTGTPENVSLAEMLQKIEISSAEASSMGSVDFIEFHVTAYDGHPVQASHFYVYPSGQIRVLMVKYDDKQVSYISVMNEDVDVEQPEWAGNSSADS